MEEMSKKTKRLEKENLNLTRKQEATNKNIFQMAEERSQSQQTIDRLTRENEKLKELCRAMQTGGYTGPGAAQGNGGATGVERSAELARQLDLEGVEGETESEYEDEEYDEDDDGEYDEEDTEEEILDAQPRTFGPPPPPPPQDEIVLNGKMRMQQPPQQQQLNGAVNGARH